MISKIIISYLIVVNMIGILVTAHDKRSAVLHKRRIRERTLFAVALIGGGTGEYFTMLVIRHKTRHLSFMLGIPLIIIAQVFAAVYVTVKL